MSFQMVISGHFLIKMDMGRTKTDGKRPTKNDRKLKGHVEF